MVETRHTEQRLSQELANTRTHLRDRLLLLRRDLDIGSHIVRSTEDQPFEWITVGFMVGWLLSRLPARKQKIYYSLDREAGTVRINKKKEQTLENGLDYCQTRDCCLCGKKNLRKRSRHRGSWAPKKSR